MDRRTTLALVVIFAVLLIYVLWSRQAEQTAQLTATPTAEASADENVVWKAPADQILSVRVVDRARSRSVAFGRETAQASWTVTEPQAQAADQLKAANSTASIARLAFTQALTDVTDLAPFGVLSPTYSLEIKLVDGSLLKMTVGDKTVTGSGYYVMREGEKGVLVVSTFSLDSILGLLDAPPFLPPTETPTPASETPLTPALAASTTP